MSKQHTSNEELKDALDDESNSDGSNWSDIEGSIIGEAILKAQNDVDTENETSDTDLDSESGVNDEALIESEILMLHEQGHVDSDPLPSGWTFIQHTSGLKIYINYREKVCTAARPYFLGTGSVRKHNIPRSAIPCLSYIYKLKDNISMAEDVAVIKNATGTNNDIEKPNAAAGANVVGNITVVANDVETPQNVIPVREDVPITENIPTVRNVSSEQNIEFERNAKLIKEVKLTTNIYNVLESIQIPDKRLQDYTECPVQKVNPSIEIVDTMKDVSADQKLTIVDIPDSDEYNFISESDDTILIQEDDSNDIEIIDEDIIMEEHNNFSIPIEGGEIEEFVVVQEGVATQNDIQNIAIQEKVVCLENDTQEHNTMQENINIHNDVGKDNDVLVKNRTVEERVALQENDCVMIDVATNDNAILVANNTKVHAVIGKNAIKYDYVLRKNTENERIILENESQNEILLVKNGTIRNDPIQKDVMERIDDVEYAASIPESIPEDYVQNIAADELDAYCRKLFQFKKIRVMRFNSWSERRQFSKRRKHVHQLHKTAPLEPKVIIKCPVQSKNGESSKKWLMNTAGKSHVCILHEYVQHSLKKQPKYSFSELENAATPYAATVTINNMKYGVGYGTSKKQAKSNAAKATLQILIPEMDSSKPVEEGRSARINDESDISNIAFFDTINVVDPRVTDFSAKTTELLPCDLLKSCLNRNKDLGEMNITYEDNGEDEEMKFTMTVGPHQVTVFCKNKREAKQQAAQAILQKLHPHVHSWGALLRLYGIGGCMGLKEKLIQNPTEQIPTLHVPQDHPLSSSTPNCNTAIMHALKDKFNTFVMQGLNRDYDENVRPLLITDI